MKELTCWLLYDDPDYGQNQGFVSLCVEEGAKRGLHVIPVLLSQLTLGTDVDGKPYALFQGNRVRPHGVLSRQRSSTISLHLEKMGIPVFNNATVSRLCNDKRQTHLFLHGIPMLPSQFIPARQANLSPYSIPYPAVVKPARGHGGRGVQLLECQAQWQNAIQQLPREDLLVQPLCSQPGKDLRVYVVFGKIIAGVLRTAQQGFISNYKRGGRATLHSLSHEERALAQQVIGRFQRAQAPLSFAGIDMLYHQGHPLVNEVEDVVGSRMLYQTSDINIAGLFLDEIYRHLSYGKNMV